MVGVRGFEPPTPSSRTMCATRLRYTPTWPRKAARAAIYGRPRRCASLAALSAFHLRQMSASAFLVQRSKAKLKVRERSFDRGRRHIWVARTSPCVKRSAHELRSQKSSPPLGWRRATIAWVAFAGNLDRPRALRHHFADRHAHALETSDLSRIVGDERSQFVERGGVRASAD